MNKLELQKIANEQTISALKMGKEFYNGSKKQKFRVVIYQTVSGNEMCVCTKPDMLKVNKKACSAWIAIGNKLSTSGIDGIVPSSLLF